MKVECKCILNVPRLQLSTWSIDQHHNDMQIIIIIDRYGEYILGQQKSNLNDLYIIAKHS